MGKKKRISITDVAKHSNVSIATVSYVLNGLSEEKRVGKEVMEKVIKASQDLGYRPNFVAKSLRNGFTKTLGLIVADISNSYFGDMAKAIENEAGKLGYTVLLGSSDESHLKESRLIDTMLDRQVDGIIVAPAEDGENKVVQLSEELPTVLIDRYIADKETNSVILDNRKSTYDAVAHLAEHGFKNIGMIGYKSNMLHIKERFNGYFQAVEDIDVINSNGPIFGEVRYQHLQPDMNETLDYFLGVDNPIDAIVFATNSLTVAGLYYFQEKGIRIPDDVGIIGFDGNVAFDFFYSPITYIEQPIRKMGERSVNLLIDRIKGKQECSQIKLSHSLVERSSSQKNKKNA